MNSFSLTTRLVAILFLAPLSVSSLAPNARAQDAMRAPIALHCEHLVEPLALDTPKPRFTWELVDKRRSARQTAYQILVAPNAEDLATAKGRLWDSDKVKSSETVLVEYAGKDLEPGQQCWWKVRAWDAGDVASPWSAVSRFGVGLLGDKEWKAQWISDATPATSAAPAAEPARLGWHSEFSPKEDEYQWIQFDLGASYPLSEIYLWQYNQGGLGNRAIKTANIFYATSPSGPPAGSCCALGFGLPEA